VLSVCCLSGGPPRRLAALLELLRPVADELVVAVDDRVDPARLGPIGELADTLVRYPFADCLERAIGWLHSLCRGDAVFRIDDDEVPSAALLDLLGAGLDPALTHAYVPRRWLWRDGALDEQPWWPDWQLRLVRPAAARFPGRVHVPIQATGPHAYLEAPLLHLDLAVNERAAREEKIRRYERVLPGLRLGGRSLNEGYYLPESRAPRVEPLAEADRALARRVLDAPELRPVEPPAARLATREEIDAHWGRRPLPAYRARLEPGEPPEPVAGEVRQLDVRVTNGGETTWPAEGYPEIRVAYRWRGREGEGLRTPFPHDVAPGETVLLPVSFRAPDEPGRHVLELDVLHEGRRWFGAVAPVEVRVRPRRRALVLLGQPPGDAAYDERVDELLAGLDPALEPIVVGPKPDWIRDRFRVEAAASAPRGPWDAVHALPAGRRRDRLRLWLRALRQPRG
jgi:hypothetical protein